MLCEKNVFISCNSTSLWVIQRHCVSWCSSTQLPVGKSFFQQYWERCQTSMMYFNYFSPFYSIIENSFYPMYLNVPFFKGTHIDIKLFCYKENHTVEILISLQLPWWYYFQEKQLNFHVMVICAVHVNTKKLLHYYLTINYHFWERLNYI